MGGRPLRRHARWPAARAGTLDAAAQLWLARSVATSRNAKGCALAVTRVLRYLTPILGRRPLCTLSGDDVRGYRLALEELGLAPLTVVHVLGDLRALLLWAVAEGRLERSPFPRRVPPRVPEQFPRGLAASEVATLEALPEPWGFVLRLLVATGLRWGEACRARREHVRGAWLEIETTKSGRVRRRSGVAEFHPHRCRHTFAMRWLEAGGSLPVLQELLGHRDLTTTMRYARVSEGLVERESARVARVLARRPAAAGRQ